MNLLIQKFGGTSVQTKENRKQVIHQIKSAIENDYQVVVTVSAIGRSPDPYATDTLIDMIDSDLTLRDERREMDMLMSCGETISSVVLSNELKQNGLSAVALTGAQAGLITDDNYNAAKIIKVKPDRVTNELKTHDVVVIAGFQGRTESGDITTLGRGGSDTTATAFGASLDAERVEIFTDVEGIMTADPRVVDEASPIDVVTYSETCDLAHQGAKVIHPRAVEIAMQAEIPIRIRSTYTDELGTLIKASRLEETGIDTPDRIVTGIAHKDGITQLNVELGSLDETMNPSVIFKTIAKAEMTVDFINISTDHVTFTIATDLVDEAIALLESKGFNIQIVKNCAKISVVGAGMTNVPGTAAEITSALLKHDVEILQTADSNTTIWLLIHDKHLNIAMNALHQALHLDEVNATTEKEKTLLLV